MAGWAWPGSARMVRNTEFLAVDELELGRGLSLPMLTDMRSPSTLKRTQAGLGLLGTTVGDICSLLCLGTALMSMKQCPRIRECKQWGSLGKTCNLFISAALPK